MEFYFIGYGASVIIGVGITYAHDIARWPGLAITDWREFLGFAIIYNVTAMILWPLMLPAIFCLTGFAKAGWSIRKPNYDR